MSAILDAPAPIGALPFIVVGYRMARVDSKIPLAGNRWGGLLFGYTNTAGEMRMGNWISVKDRIPEYKDGSVLVHFENGSIETVHREYFTDITCGLDENGVQLYCKMFKNHDPAFTHWMELPEPPV